jgi:signal transduction histidine kinase/ActR/RegA family two-component response regulator
VLRALGFDSYVCFPLHGREGLVGTLSFGRRRPPTFSLQELELCRTVSNHVALAVERSRLLEALKLSETTLRSYYDTAPLLMGIVELGHDGEIVHVYDNAATHRFLGVDAATPGRSAQELGAAPDTIVRWRSAYLESARTNEAVRFEYEHVGPTGPRWLRVGVVPIETNGGLTRRFAYVAEDVSDWKRAEDALREADRRKDEFLATLAHELRNPLAPIRFALTLLDRAGPETATRARQVIERQVAHLVRLVDDLLDVSRITRNKIQLRREPLALADAMRSAVESAAPAAAASNHHLTIVEPGPDVHVDADLARLVQVFTNLLNNAVKFTPPGGHIRFEATATADQVTVSVRDNGPGVDPALLPHLFEMFHQGPGAVPRSQGGLGIGLALARRLVEMHGGSIEAWSAGEGQGAEFRVTLPRLEVVASVAVPSSRPEPAHAIERLHVLAVDDNVDSAGMLGTLVETLGHHAATAHDGTSALKLAEAAPPDVALLDIGLPGMNGYELAATFRASPRLRHAYLVAITGWGQEEDRRRAREAGFDWHFTKPADPAALSALLAKVADERSGRGPRLPQTRKGDTP